MFQKRSTKRLPKKKQDKRIIINKFIVAYNLAVKYNTTKDKYDKIQIEKYLSKEVTRERCMLEEFRLMNDFSRDFLASYVPLKNSLVGIEAKANFEKNKKIIPVLSDTMSWLFLQHYFERKENLKFENDDRYGPQDSLQSSFFTNSLLKEIGDKRHLFKLSSDKKLKKINFQKNNVAVAPIKKEDSYEDINRLIRAIGFFEKQAESMKDYENVQIIDNENLENEDDFQKIIELNLGPTEPTEIINLKCKRNKKYSGFSLDSLESDSISTTRKGCSSAKNLKSLRNSQMPIDSNFPTKIPAFQRRVKKINVFRSPFKNTHDFYRIKTERDMRLKTNKNLLKDVVDKVGKYFHDSAKKDNSKNITGDFPLINSPSKSTKKTINFHTIGTSTKFYSAKFTNKMRSKLQNSLKNSLLKHANESGKLFTTQTYFSPKRNDSSRLMMN